MTDEDAQSINRGLGKVEGQVQTLIDQWARQEAAAAQLRQRNIDKLEALQHQMDRMANDVLSVQQDIAELKNEAEPMIEEYKAEQNRRLGRRGLWISIGAVLSAGGAVAYRALSDLWHSLPPTHPPSP